jgi:hypothetical protein
MFKSNKTSEAGSGSRIQSNKTTARKRRIDNKDLIVLCLRKAFADASKFETIEELKDWLRKENAKPQWQINAEILKLIKEAREELEKCTYLY